MFATWVARIVLMQVVRKVSWFALFAPWYVDPAYRFCLQIPACQCQSLPREPYFLHLRYACSAIDCCCFEEDPSPLEEMDPRRQRPPPLLNRQELCTLKFWSRRTAKLSESVKINLFCSCYHCWFGWTTNQIPPHQSDRSPGRNQNDPVKQEP